MSGETESVDRERLSASTKSDVRELKAIVETLKVEITRMRAAIVDILKAIKEVEDHTGEPMMPKGEHYGYRFDD